MTQTQDRANARLSTTVVTPNVPANDVTSSLHSAYVRNAALESNHFSMETDDHGAVTLDGHVHTYAERRRVERFAWLAPGVTNVHNRLEVRA